MAIDGNTFKLKAGKDFDYKIEEGKVTLTGKNNFKGSISQWYREYMKDEKRWNDYFVSL